MSLRLGSKELNGIEKGCNVVESAIALSEGVFIVWALAQLAGGGRGNKSVITRTGKQRGMLWQLFIGICVPVITVEVGYRSKILELG